MVGTSDRFDASGMPRVCGSLAIGGVQPTRGVSPQEATERPTCACSCSRCQSPLTRSLAPRRSWFHGPPRWSGYPALALRRPLDLEGYRGFAPYRSGKKSRPRAISTMFLAAPTRGMAFRPVSSVPLITPLRLMVDATVATAMRAPTQGRERDRRRERRAPPQRVTRCVIVMPPPRARDVPALTCYKWAMGVLRRPPHGPFCTGGRERDPL